MKDLDVRKEYSQKYCKLCCQIDCYDVELGYCSRCENTSNHNNDYGLIEKHIKILSIITICFGSIIGMLALGIFSFLMYGSYKLLTLPPETTQGCGMNVLAAIFGFGISMVALTLTATFSYFVVVTGLALSKGNNNACNKSILLAVFNFFLSFLIVAIGGIQVFWISLFFILFAFYSFWVLFRSNTQVLFTQKSS